MITQHLCYKARLFSVILSLPGFPGLALWLLPDPVHFPGFAFALLGSLVLVGLLSRYLLVIAPYKCYSCGDKTMRTFDEESPRETHIKYRCDSCGYETSTGVAWHES